MRVIDLTFKSPYENIEYDEKLLNLAEENDTGPILRFWESMGYFVCLGLLDKEENSIFKEACDKDHIPVVKRNSGGGTVVLGPGCLTYVLILPKEKQFIEVRKSYHHILSTVCNALQKIGYKAEIKGVFDITIENKKIGGSAQLRKKRYFLHHGTILYNFNINLISRYLKKPERKPKYRGNRSHKDFLFSLNYPSSSILKQRLTEEMLGSLFLS